MLRLVHEIVGYSLLAKDGKIGKCRDFLFDDRDWVIRYMVAKTTNWLPGRKIVISPVFLGKPDWVSGEFPIDLTREQIEQSPPLNEHAPVSRQYEVFYHQNYSLPYYWQGPELWGAFPDPTGVVHPISTIPQSAIEHDMEQIEIEEGNLRSSQEITGYHVSATDGNAGTISAILLDDFTWSIRYLVVDTRHWLPGRKVLLSPQWIESVSWANENVYVTLETETIKQSPKFDPAIPVNREYETRLYDYYGRSYYWI